MENVVHTNIIKVGNSKGIRIPKEYLKDFGEKVILQLTNDGLIIRPDQEESVPPLKEWNALFAKAIASGEKPENDIFEGLQNKSDDTEWEW